MGTSRYTQSFNLGYSAQQVYDWHFRLGNFVRSFPPWENILIHRASHKNSRDLQFRLALRWQGRLTPFIFHIKATDQAYTVRTKLETTSCFKFEQETVIKPTGTESCTVQERVEYALTHHWLCETLRAQKLDTRIDKYFTYKHSVLSKDLAAEQPKAPSRILVTGASGLVGSELLPYLTSMGHTVYQLVRSKNVQTSHSIYYNPQTRKINVQELEGFDTVIHLMGKNVVCRWSAAHKKALVQSRVSNTQYLTKLLMGLQSPPKTFIMASAAGIYGNHHEDPVVETTEHKGDAFLKTLCEDWERAALPLSRVGVRVVPIRLPPVLSSKGGMLKLLLQSFRWGVHGISHIQDNYLSWVAIDDVVGAISHIHMTEGLQGPVNLCSPHPITNGEFYHALQSKLERRWGIKIPRPLVQAFGGEFAKEVLFTSVRMLPHQLTTSGYAFRYPVITQALDHLVF